MNILVKTLTVTVGKCLKSGYNNKLCKKCNAQLVFLIFQKQNKTKQMDRANFVVSAIIGMILFTINAAVFPNNEITTVICLSITVMLCVYLGWRWGEFDGEK